MPNSCRQLRLSAATSSNAVKAVRLCHERQLFGTTSRIHVSRNFFVPKYVFVLQQLFLCVFHRKSMIRVKWYEEYEPLSVAITSTVMQNPSLPNNSFRVELNVTEAKDMVDAFRRNQVLR